MGYLNRQPEVPGWTAGVPSSSMTTSDKALSQPFRLHWFAVLALILGAWMAGFGYGARAALKDARQECCDRHRQGLPACGEAAP
jgi:hypothetical protein